MKFIRYFMAADQSARYSTFFSLFAVKKVKYYADWSERSTRTVATEHLKMTKTGFRKLLFLLFSAMYYMTSRTTERYCS